MKRSSLFILLIFITVIALSLYLKRTISPSEKNRIESKVDDLFTTWDNTDSPGAALAVVKGKKVVYVQGYGSANLEYGIPISTRTKFHVASLSKQFTAFSIILLAESGRLSLDDDIRRYLPDMPDFGKMITIRHLLHHTSGLRDQWELLTMAGWRMDDVISTDHILKMLKRQSELNFNPGEQYLYSNTGYTLLAEIVESVTKQSFLDWTYENIFSPLHMENTFFNNNHEAIIKNRASSYSPHDGSYKNKVLSYATAGATSLMTTAEDLAKWIKNFESKAEGSESVMAQMHERGRLNNGDLINYAAGLSYDEHRGFQTIGHSGADAGFRSRIDFFPTERLAIVIISNLSTMNTRQLAMDIADLYLPKKTTSKKPVIDNEKRSSIEIDPKILKSYEGLYQIRPDYVLSINVQNGQLFVQGTGEPQHGLYAESERIFFRRDAEFELLFLINNIGDITKAVVRSGGTEIEGTRVSPLSFSADQMAEYTGEYYSHELDTHYRIILDKNRLYATHKKHDDIPLDAITRDYFSGSEMFFRTVHFTRDEAGQIDGFLLSGHRVLHIRFEKYNLIQ